MELAFEDSAFDWTFSLPPQHVHPATLEGAGAVCETKRFDSFYNDSGDHVVLPAGQKYIAQTGRAYESALTVMTYWNTHQDVDMTVLEIKSPHMKAALKAVVPEYRSFNITVRNIIIKNEPRCLFHYRQELLSYGATLQQQGDDLEAPRHIQHLISYMWDVFPAEILAFSVWEMSNDSLEHQYLWMVFRPGDFVYVREPSRKAFQFAEMERKHGSWTIRGHCIDYDGDSFGFRSTQASISCYDDLKPLRELEVVNFDHLAAGEREMAKEELVKRGRRFINIQGQQYLWYDGESDKSTGCQTKTRIMTDYEGFITRGLGAVVMFSGGKKTFNASNALEEMTETDLMICNTSVAGYSLRDNEWGQFDIDLISDIKFDPQAFDLLILPDKQKQQILSLVRVHEDVNFSFDDLIKGKGRGMVFLLYGETGVGKTLTAESIAEYYRKPLLRLDAGILGTSPRSVEIGLKSAFDLAERWHALLLLDEADVYLEQRKSKNLVHNGIVSVFLRMLEYYHGILFLTTNRISSFDTAFISRIHLAIHYMPLTVPGRRELFLAFLNRISVDNAAALSQQGVLDKIAEEQLNGRQIKNLVRTASALALDGNSPGGRIDQQHLEMALQPVKQFSQAMKEEITQEEYRKEEEVVEVQEGNENEEDQGGYDDDEEGESFDEAGYDGEEEDDEDQSGYGKRVSQQSKRRRLY